VWNVTQLDLAMVGNGSWAGLIDPRGRVVWACLPRFDGDPVFSALLAGEEAGESGLFEIALEDCVESQQRYLRNTAIVVTTLADRRGASIEITDFAPRYVDHGRTYRPLMLVRRVRPLSGHPRIGVRLRPCYDWGAGSPDITFGSNHVRYVMPHVTVRLTTDAPIPWILDEKPFVLEEPLDLILGPDETLASAIAPAARESFERTREYWLDWSRSLSIPFEWQSAVIRAAITLKMCAYQATGAIVAAVTTSIPEAPGTSRNWDYRYCWLRDAYFVVHALNRLGATKTMEGFLRYIGNVVAGSPDGSLQPVYGLGCEARLEEREIPHLEGYRGMGPVRVGNQAFEHVQNDVYGSVILAATQSFFDERLRRPGDRGLFERLERIGEQALERFAEPDAGLWEYRTRARVHTFSAIMCWAACDRLARIAERLALAERAHRWRAHADHIHRVVCREAWSSARGCFVESFGGGDLDASLLLMEHVGFLAADDPRFARTVEAIEKELRDGPYLFRYRAPDDFGAPRTAFNICTFWYVDALCALGRRDEARELFENMLARRNPVGLLSEDLDPVTGELWGNFPQTYSMVGLISCAMRLSRSWGDAL
jgi:GH15 family glucan-1,4-alpha-glucosidase